MTVTAYTDWSPAFTVRSLFTNDVLMGGVVAMLVWVAIDDRSVCEGLPFTQSTQNNTTLRTLRPPIGSRHLLSATDCGPQSDTRQDTRGNATEILNLLSVLVSEWFDTKKCGPKTTTTSSTPSAAMVRSRKERNDRRVDRFGHQRYRLHHSDRYGAGDRHSSIGTDGNHSSPKRSHHKNRRHYEKYRSRSILRVSYHR
jgi:hypothetical protein